VNELDALLAPEVKRLHLGGRDVDCGEITLRKLGPFMRVLQKLSDVDLDDPVAVGAHTEDLVAACAIATGLEEEWIYTLRWDELVHLTVAVIELNVRFFARGLMPQVRHMAAHALRGEMSSPSS